MIVRNSETQKLLERIKLIFNKSKQIIIPDIQKDVVSKFKVQFSKLPNKNMDLIGDYNYVADKPNLQEKIVADLDESAGNPELLVISISWYEEDAGCTVTEFAIFNYDKDTGKAYSDPIKIYIDIGDDGYIGYARDIYYDWLKEE